MHERTSSILVFWSSSKVNEELKIVIFYFGKASYAYTVGFEHHALLYHVHLKASLRHLGGIERCAIYRFLWGGDKDHCEISLVIWEDVYEPKQIRGMSLIRLANMNKALLMKVVITP